MSDKYSILDFLRKLATTPGNRTARIIKLQDMIFVERIEGATEAESEILRELAYDLSYYVENPEWRAQDPSYYGEERLQEEISEALSRLSRLSNAGEPEGR